jgi:periplasmic copper chaperone A
MRCALSKPVIVGVVASIGTVLAAGGVAFAHIDPDPLAMQAGTTGTVQFKVEHGCNGSPTTDIKIQLPNGITGVSAVDKAGWTSTITGNVLEYKGGPLAADQEDHFDITLTAPTQPGDIRFPIIQTCQQGELAWIEVAAEGAPEPDHPAPTLKITSGPPTSADLTPEPEATDEGGGEGTAAPVIASAPATTSPSKDDSSNTGAVIVIVVASLLVIGAGGVMIARRRGVSARPR